MDRRPSRVATSIVNMRLITFGRRVVVPLSLIVLALAAVSAPPVVPRSMLVLMAVGALGFVGLALTRSWHRARRFRSVPQMDDVIQVAKDDADVARMGSDAG
jgi:hypothetical protein